MLGTYCTNEDLNLQELLEEMKSYQRSRSYLNDKNLLNIYDKNLRQILSVNGAYMINYPMVRLLLNKLSAQDIKADMRKSLNKVRIRNDDSENTHNSIQVFKKLIAVARKHIDNKLDIRTTDTYCAYGSSNRFQSNGQG